MVALQWNLTFSGINTGSAEVHHLMSDKRVANLSKAAGSTFSCCRFVEDDGKNYTHDLLLTGSDSGVVILWRIEPAAVMRLHTLPPHGSPVIAAEARLGRVVTREQVGETKVWDIQSLLNEKAANHALVLEETSKAFTSRVAVAIGERRLIMASMDCALLCYDVWRPCPKLGQ